MDDRSKIAKLLGKAGGEKTKAKYGSEHYKDIINKRWDKYRKRKKLLASKKNTP